MAQRVFKLARFKKEEYIAVNSVAGTALPPYTEGQSRMERGETVKRYIEVSPRRRGLLKRENPT